jgi:hypothetical protein
VEPKRPPKPVNITGQAKLSPVVPNYLDIAWGYEPTKPYAFQICVVRKLLPDELLKIVRNKKISKVGEKKVSFLVHSSLVLVSFIVNCDVSENSGNHGSILALKSNYVFVST